MPRHSVWFAYMPPPTPMVWTLSCLPTPVVENCVVTPLSRAFTALVWPSTKLRLKVSLWRGRLR